MPPRTVRVLRVVLLAAIVAACAGDDPTGTNPPAAILAVAGDDQVGIGLAALPAQISVRVNDAGGAPLANVAVQFQATGGGSVSQATANTDAQGVASVAWTLGEPGSAQAATATVTGLAPVTFTATATVAWVVAGCCEPNAIVTSMDGITWTTRTTRFEEAFAVAFDGRQWIAGGEGTAMLATSPDGITWTDRTVPHGDFVFAVASDGSQWVAGGCCAEALATSADGITWTARTTGFELFTGIASSGTRWVAVGGAPDGHSIATSTDGVSWSPVTGGPAEEGVAVAWNGSLWLVTDLDGGTVFTSSDAMTWTPRPTGLVVARAVAWNGDSWLLGGVREAALSADAVDFTVHDTTGIGSGRAAAWGGSQWILTGTAMAFDRITTSPDGTAWTTRASPLLDGHGIAYARPLLPPLP